MIEIIVTNAVVVACLGWLFKVWISKRLQSSLDKELENFRANLAKDVARDSIQQVWNNNKRMELFSQLYEVIVDADFELKALLLNLKVDSSEHVASRARNFCEKYTEVNALLHKNELYLDTAIVEELRDCYKPYFDITMDSLRKGADCSDVELDLPDSIEDIANLADEPRKRAVSVFRKLSGMEV